MLPAAVLCMLPAAVARAHQPPPGWSESVGPGDAFLEVAPWLGVGGGASEVGMRNQPLFELSLDVGATLRISEAVRVGLWGQVRTATFATFEPIAGVRFTVAPADVHWFGVDGQLQIGFDAGAGYAWRDVSRFGLGDGPVLAGRIWWGFVAPLRLLSAYPWRCEGRPDYEGQRCTPPAGGTSGARLYVELRRGLGSAEEWEVSGGLDFEVLGSAWFLTGG